MRHAHTHTPEVTIIALVYVSTYKHHTRIDKIRTHTYPLPPLPPASPLFFFLLQLKTTNIALILCMNIGTDPPDVIRTPPCATLECWTGNIILLWIFIGLNQFLDPQSAPPQKAIELIGKNLQTQYERWQGRAKCKQLLDPTVDDVKKVACSLRKSAKVLILRYITIAGCNVLNL